MSAHGADVNCSFTPRSDFSANALDLCCLYMIAEVVSEKNKSDRWRMILEGIVATRVGTYLMKKTAKKRFVLLGIYLTSELIAELYLFCQEAKTEKHVRAFLGVAPALLR